MIHAISFVLLTLMVFFVSNCGDENEELFVVASPSQTFILPGDLTFEDDTCYNDGTIAEPRIRIDQISTQWVGTGSFQPVVVQVTIPEVTGVVSEFECAISGEAQATLGAFLGYGGATLTNPGTGASATSICPINCGGITVNSTSSFSVSATLKLIGIQIVTNADGSTTQKPVTAQTTLVLQGLP